jgi:transposase InsO family protein
VRYAFIREQEREFRVAAMCRVLEVGASGYYRWRGRKPAARAAENKRLMEKIKVAHADSRGIYGSPKIYRCLRRDGEAVNHKRVERLMREHDLRAKRVRKIKRTTDSRHMLPVAENVLARQFSAARPDEVWTSDITYVWTSSTFTHGSSSGGRSRRALRSGSLSRRSCKGKPGAGALCRRWFIPTAVASTRVRPSGGGSPPGAVGRA